MLKAKKRITKRQMKEDKLVTYYFKASDYLRDHSRQITWAAVGTAVVIIAFFLYSREQSSNERAALVELTKASSEYFNKDYAGAESLLLKVIASYGSTNSGELATFYLADTYFNLEKYDEASRYFNQYLDRASDPILKASALAGVAGCLEERGSFAEAAMTYQKAADEFKAGFQAPQNLLSSARCYRLAGNLSEARKILTRLIEEFSDSEFKSDAELLLAELVS